MALRDIGTRRQPSAYIKWGHSRVVYLTYTTGILKFPMSSYNRTFAIIILMLK